MKMSKFESREYNKHCKSEHESCMREVKKGIILNGEASGQKGAASYPTDGPERKLAEAGEK